MLWDQFRFQRFEFWTSEVPAGLGSTSRWAATGAAACFSECCHCGRLMSTVEMLGSLSLDG